MTTSMQNTPRKKINGIAAALMAVTVGISFSIEGPAQAAPTTDRNATATTATVPASAVTTSNTSAEDEEVVELSPFTVTADNSKGYTATSSLSGTRLNTDLKDIGSSITEMTVDFLKDIGANSFLDAVSYAPGTVSFFSDFNDKNGNNSVRGIQYVVRGMNTTGVARDFFRTGFPLDMYNTERLSLSRGANSVLYGIADPTGMINTTLAKPNMQRDRMTASADWGSYGVYRLNLDVNATGKLRVLRREIPVGVRFITFTEERPKYIKPDIYEQTRYYLSVAIQPWKGATIRGSYENLDFNQTGSRMFAPFDGVTQWRDSGMHTVSGPVNDGDPLAPGVYRNGKPGLVVVTNSDGPQYAMNILNTARPVYSEVPDLIDSRINLTDFSVYPADKVNWLGVNNSGAKWSGQDITLTYEQLIGKNLAFEVGISRENFRLNQVIPIVANFFLYTDINERLPNGAPNPYFGIPYMDYSRGEQNDSATHTDYRATLTYTLDLRKKAGWLGKFFGRHRIVGLAERYIYSRGLDQLYEYNVTPLTSIGHSSSILSRDSPNRVNRRTYFGSAHPYLTDSTQPLGNVDVISNQFDVNNPTYATGSVNARMFREANSTHKTKDVIDSGLIAIQSFMANERLVFTGGLRWDNQELYRAEGWAHPVTGEWSSASEMSLPGTSYSKSSGRTGTLGLTYHVSRWLSLSWNKSENFNPPGAVFTVYDTPLPSSKGKTEDVGIKFRLFDEKIVGSFNYFQAERLGERYRSGSNPYRIMALWNVVDPTMMPTKEPRSWSDIRDLETQGYEFQVTANPTPAWRISANVTQLKTAQHNLKPFTQAYFNEHVETWSQPQFANLSCPVEGDSRNLTVTDVIGHVRRDIMQSLATNGQPAHNLNEWIVNFVGNYTVLSGPLKNFGFGGAQQWRKGPLLGFVYMYDGEIGASVPDIHNRLYGEDWWNTNIWFTYERRILKNKVRMILKLSINNLFDKRTSEMENYIDSMGEQQTARYRFLTPRNYMLSATFQY